MIVMAQLLAAAAQRCLPARYELPTQSRAKVIELISGTAMTREVHVPPLELLSNLRGALEKAHWTFMTDKNPAIEQVFDFDCAPASL